VFGSEPKRVLDGTIPNMYSFGCNGLGWDRPRGGNIRQKCGIDWVGKIGQINPSLFLLIVDRGV
jgi:hypothetical protein